MNQQKFLKKCIRLFIYTIYQTRRFSFEKKGKKRESWIIAYHKFLEGKNALRMLSIKAPNKACSVRESVICEMILFLWRLILTCLAEWPLFNELTRKVSSYYFLGTLLRYLTHISSSYFIQLQTPNMSHKSYVVYMCKPKLIKSNRIC